MDKLKSSFHQCLNKKAEMLNKKLLVRQAENKHLGAIIAGNNALICAYTKAVSDINKTLADGKNKTSANELIQ